MIRVYGEIETYAFGVGELAVIGGDFNTGDKTCATSAAMRRVPEAERCSPSEVAFASPITAVKQRFGISEMLYLAASRR
jgi:hypothetical protein